MATVGHRPIDSGLIGLVSFVGWKVILRASGGQDRYQSGVMHKKGDAVCSKFV